jgi:hypothetical protein
MPNLCEGRFCLQVCSVGAGNEKCIGELLHFFSQNHTAEVILSLT